MTRIAKGSYRYGGSLPYYIFGEYIDGTTINSQTEANTINTASGNEYVEALRPRIYEALQTWP